ncbi:MAG: glycogen debranching protein GlgX [Gammaproteobacteria bacterium]|nr:glycogen debranching protein GlgX [Gammaproteobacteria bacterium]
MRRHWQIGPGRRLPGGATPGPAGVNFSLFSRNATRVWLVLYADETSAEPLDVIELDPRVNRTFFFWHVFVRGARPGLYYTWKVDGPDDPAAGFRFDPQRELLDPWAREVSAAAWDRDANRHEGRTAIRGRIVPEDDYDWEGDKPLRIPLEDTVIYEMHVRGFTRHASASVQHPGTYRGLIEKIPHLVELGVTHVELLPVMAFDEQDLPPAAAKRGLCNYWGYSPYGFFAPHPRFAASAGDERNEFRDLVKALHRAGIGVILDVVLNHTAEGGEDGPVISFKGFGNEFFYHLDPEDRRRYRDFSGCGNAINCNHPLVARFLLQCLEFWARDMHVDGFRLDLASVLSRGEDGEPMYHAPVLWSIEFSDVLGPARLIAEAWDAAGLYQVGDFPGFRWLEWNGQYRDTMRRFLRGEPGLLGDVATRLTGSSDLYGDGRRPTNSVNFVTCHDGFTLWDLVSYDRKHNEANGEKNRDGGNHDFSWNSGAEGPTRDPAVNRLREQRARNFVALLMLSQGVPMLLAGDELLRTQRGNNNAYCQDNEISWLDWTAGEGRAAMLRFTREMIALRRRHRCLRRSTFIEPDVDGPGGIRWYGANGEPPDWHDPHARVLALTLAGLDAAEPSLHVMINMSGGTLELPLPSPPGAADGGWRRVVDTSLPAPHDIVSPDAASTLAASSYPVAPLTVAVFESQGR